MKRLFKKNSGFTLVEILLVLVMVGILATVAIRSYMNSTDTFNFLSQYKNIFSTIRTARSYAITNKDTNGSVPKRYGVKIESNSVTLFADQARDYYFDPVVAGQNPPPADIVIATKTFNLQDTPYNLSARDGSNQPLTMPVLLFYEKGSAEFSARYTSGNTNPLLAKNDHRYLSIQLSEDGDDLSKYIVIFQVSGLAEEYDQLDQFNQL